MGIVFVISKINEILFPHICFLCVFMIHWHARTLSFFLPFPGANERTMIPPLPRGVSYVFLVSNTPILFGLLFYLTLLIIGAYELSSQNSLSPRGNYQLME
jgi:hypothetical protein